MQSAADRRSLLVWAVLLCIHNAVGTAVPFFLPISTAVQSVILDGSPTDLQITEAECSDALDRGQLEIGDNTVLDITCIPPRYVYFYPDVGAHPALTRTATAAGCLVGDQHRYNLSITATKAGYGFAAQPSPTLRHLLAFHITWDQIRAGFADGLAQAVGLPTGIDGLYAITQDQALNIKNLNASILDIATHLNEFDGKFNTFLTNQQQLNVGLNAVNRIVYNIQTEQRKINEGVASAILKQRDATAILQQDINHTATALAMLSENVDERVSQLNGNIQLLADDTRDQLNAVYQAATADQKAATSYLIDAIQSQTSKIWNMTLTLAHHIQEEVDELRGNLQRTAEQVNVLGQIFWLYAQKVQTRRLISTQFWDAKAQIASGQSTTLVSSGGIAPQAGGLQTVDLKTLYEGWHINYVQQQIGVGGPFAQLVNTNINMYANTEQSLDSAQGMMNTEWIIRRFGPANCTRAFVGFDNLNQEIPEDPLYRNQTKCAFWIEVVTTRCDAANSTFSWREATFGLDAYSQSNDIKPEYCLGGSTSDTLVFRSFPDFKDWLAESVCDITLWPSSPQEFMLTDIVQIPAYRTFVQQVRAHCAGSIWKQNSYTPATLFSYIWMFLHEGVQGFITNVQTAELKKYGRLPNGFEFSFQPLMFTPVRFDEFDNAIFDGGADPLECIVATWLIASRSMIPLRYITPKTGAFVEKQILLNSYTDNPGFVRDYINDTLTTDIQLIEELSPLVPDHALLFGDPINDNLIYDVPQSLIETTNQYEAAWGTFGHLLAPPGTTEIPTFEEYQSMKGPRWSTGVGGLNPFAFTFDKALDATGSPYCVVTGGFPLNGTADLDRAQFSQSPIPNSILCTLLKFFRIEVVFSGGQRELHLIPRTWGYRFRFAGYSGRVTSRVQTFCPQPTLTSLKEDGLQLVLVNSLENQVTINYVGTTTVPAEASFCTFDENVVIPAAPVPKVIYFPACTGLTLNFFRKTIDPVTSLLTSVPCNTPVSASSIAQSVAAASGVPPDVISSIAFSTNQAVVGLQNLAIVVGSVLEALTARSFSDTEIQDEVAPILAPFQGDPVGFLATSRNFSVANGITPLINALRDRIRIDTQNSSFILNQITAIVANITTSNDLIGRLLANESKILENNEALAANISAITPIIPFVLNLTHYLDVEDLRSGKKSLWDLIAEGLAGVGGGVGSLISAAGKGVGGAIGDVLGTTFGAASLVVNFLIIGAFAIGASVAVVATYHFCFAKKSFGGGGGGGGGTQLIRVVEKAEKSVGASGPGRRSSGSGKRKKSPGPTFDALRNEGTRSDEDA